MITQEELRKLLHYNSITGVFKWRKSGKGRQNGLIAGNIFKNNYGKTYVQISIDNKKYYAHRLAWLYMLGEFPKNQIDHADGNGSNDTWINMSEATHQENSRNQRLSVRNTSGCTGVSWDKKQEKWKSSIKANGKSITLGHFPDKNDAIKARKDAEKKYGFHPNHGSIRPL